MVPLKPQAIRDPLYKSIVSQLESELDPLLFERCMTDLLRTEWPTLVPVPGGSDSGVDGAVGVPAESTVPLIVTTAADVLRNLKRSLKAYVKGGGTQRVALLATSRRLTPQRRRNLETAAAKANVKLLQVYTQEAIADRLYHSPRWTYELLGLTGNPAALSLFPITDRPMVGETLIGREADLQWLLAGQLDLLVVGQPGSGKTFLMHVAARRAGGLFVVNDNLTNIAGDVREKKPHFLIVDDAHLRAQLLRDLRQLRQETQSEFRILANSWPGDQETAQRALGLDAGSTRELQLLTRDEIVEVLKSLGITGPTGLVYELVNQADGRPGLAVTLAQLWLHGDVKSLASADALYRDIVHTFRPLIGDQATTVLAAFALGGDYGMRLDEVANFLSMPLAQLRTAVTRLAAGGVLTDIANERLSVRPAALRHALVRDVFFTGAQSIPVDQLLAAVPNTDEAVRTLIGARARGGRVPDSLLHRLLPICQSSATWGMFVRLGQGETEWVLRERPDLLTSIGGAALEEWPSGVLPMLLNAAIGDERPLGPNPGHPLRLISDWASGGVPATPEALSRRILLADVVISWLDQGGDADVGVHAVASALSPGFEDISNDPGSARSITMRWGLLTPSELEAVEGIWPRLLTALSRHQPLKWSPIFDLLHNWLYPMRGPQSIPDYTRKQMSAFAGRMAKDVAGVAAHRPGVLHMLRRTLERSEHEDLDVTIDREFEVLYPVREFGTNLRDEEAGQAEAARVLAAEWVGQAVAEVVKRFTEFEREAELSRITWPRWSPFICEQIAPTTTEPLVWANELRSTQMKGDLLHPFFKRLLAEGGNKEADFVRECLDIPHLQRSAVAAVLVAKRRSPELVEMSLSRVEGMGDWLGFLCAHGDVDEEIIGRLLRHQDRLIASAIAGALWHKDHSNAADRPGWRDAVIGSTADHDFNLEDVFRAHPDIAADWLKARMVEDSDVFWRHSMLVETAARVLTANQRRMLLSEVRSQVWGNDLVTALVGSDLDLFKELLNNPDLRDYHLSPLHGQPNDEWVAKAIVGLEAGYTTKQLIQAAFGGSLGWTGDESGMWADWVSRFDTLKQHADERVQALGKLGSEVAAANRSAALRRERAEAIHGHL